MRPIWLQSSPMTKHHFGSHKFCDYGRLKFDKVNTSWYICQTVSENSWILQMRSHFLKFALLFSNNKLLFHPSFSRKLIVLVSYKVDSHLQESCVSVNPAWQRIIDFLDSSSAKKSKEIVCTDFPEIKKGSTWQKLKNAQVSGHYKSPQHK